MEVYLDNSATTNKKTVLLDFKDRLSKTSLVTQDANKKQNDRYDDEGISEKQTTISLSDLTHGFLSKKFTNPNGNNAVDSHSDPEVNKDANNDTYDSILKTQRYGLWRIKPTQQPKSFNFINQIVREATNIQLIV